VELISAEAADEALDQDIRDMVIKARALAGLDGAAPEAIDQSEDAQQFEADPVLDPKETVERAIAQIVERARITPADALKLMEQEADEDGRDLVEVAAAVLADAA
jgi:ANTAR domain-containing protein